MPHKDPSRDEPHARFLPPRTDASCPAAVHALRPDRSGQGSADPHRQAAWRPGPSRHRHRSPGPDRHRACARRSHTRLSGFSRRRLGSLDATAGSRPRGLAQYVSLLERPARGGGATGLPGRGARRTGRLVSRRLVGADGSRQLAVDPALLRDRGGGRRCRAGGHGSSLCAVPSFRPPCARRSGQRLLLSQQHSDRGAATAHPLRQSRDDRRGCPSRRRHAADLLWPIRRPDGLDPRRSRPTTTRSLPALRRDGPRRGAQAST